MVSITVFAVPFGLLLLAVMLAIVVPPLSAILAHVAFGIIAQYWYVLLGTATVDFALAKAR